MVIKIRCQLQIDPPADGAWNMAVDESLLAAASARQQPTLRFYQWDSPTLSLGYFQPFEDRNHHPASLKTDVVRRLSGGGAILHDRELTYSLVLPAIHPLAHDTQLLYDAVHRVLVQILRIAIAGAPRWQVEPCTESSEQDRFLCFQRRFLGDILLSREGTTRHKVVGSAQRRRRGAVLQHGSILLGRSEVATELPGIRELTGIDIRPETLLATMPTALAKSLNLDLSPAEFSTDRNSATGLIRQEKYSTESWTKRR